MTDLESLVRLSRPESLEPGLHRDQLARILMKRCNSYASESWPVQRYALALTLGLLCFAMTICLQPRTPVSRLWAEQRAILSSLIPADHESPAPHPATPSIVSSRKRPNNISRDNIESSIHDDRKALHDILSELTDNPL